MRIAFLCGSVEPGKDGVGDYVRNLSAELTRTGNTILIIAIADRFVNTNQTDELTIGGKTIELYRYPYGKALHQNGVAAASVLQVFRPAVLSIQYVSFGFDNKGLPFGLSRSINVLKGDWKLHLMMHELWVGMSKQSSVKERIWGTVQKLLIRSLISRIRPDFISTQTLLYQQQLKLIGFSSSYLPLFSNIPVLFPRKEWNDVTMGKLTFVVFGAIHADAPIRDFAEEISRYIKETGKRVELVFVGRCGQEQEKWVEAWKNEHLAYIIKGEQSAAAVSEILGTATFGLNTTAYALMEKSGTLAAMQAHGLPVISLAKEWTPDIKMDKVIGYATDVLRYKKGTLKAILEKEKKPERSHNSLSRVADSFFQLVSKHVATDIIA